MEKELISRIEKCQRELYNTIMYVQQKLNDILHYNEESDELLKYSNSVLDRYINYDTSLNGLKKCIESIFSLNVTSKTFLSEFRDESEQFYVNIHKVREVILRLVADVYQLKKQISRSSSQEIVNKLKLEPAISKHISIFYEKIKEFDEGKRNKSLHEGSFMDEEIDKLVGEEMMDRIQRYKRDSNYFQNKKTDLFIKREKSYSDLSTYILDFTSELNSILVNEIDIRIKKLAKMSDTGSTVN